VIAKRAPALAVVAASMFVGAGLDTAGSVDARRAPQPLVESMIRGTVCLDGTTADDLDRLFDAEPAGVVGADYQRATALPDGRVFWTFQDGAVRGESGAISIVHNIAMLQDGPCFQVLYGGTRAAPRSFLFADRTQQFRRWFWPLDAEIGADGLLYVFVAEMLEESDDYLVRTVPQGTRVAVFDPAANAIVSLTRSADSSASLYGWSITSDDHWTYLYAQCYRQFGFDEYAFVRAFDRYCSPRVTVGRVPRGRLLDAPSYWDGSRWQADPAAAKPVIDAVGRRINADQIEWTGGSFVSVNKEGDWWGDTIYFARSARATGPFTVYDSLPAVPKCPDCNTFFATWVPASAASRPPSTLVFTLGHNRWDGVISAVYRPTFHEVPAPPLLAAGNTFELTVPGGGDLDAVVMTVAAVLPRSAGYLTAFPCDRRRPTASNLNFSGPDVVTNLVVVRPDADGRVCLFSLADTDLVVDLAGGFEPGSGFQPVDEPLRLVDTRIGLGAPGGRVGAGETLRVAVPGDGDLAAAVVNLTAVFPGGPGHITAYPCDQERPTTSNLNFRGPDVVANLVMARLDRNSGLCFFALVDTDLVIDLAGTFGQPSSQAPLGDPQRLVDTRIGLGTERRRLAPGETLELNVPGGTGAAGAVLNVTAVLPSAQGHITAHPCDRGRPTASNLNYAPLDLVANLTVVRPDGDGRVCLFTLAETDLVVDLAAVIPFGTGYLPGDEPVRVLDTRDGTGVQT
jgi:hypothetical protein